MNTFASCLNKCISGGVKANDVTIYLYFSAVLNEVSVSSAAALCCLHIICHTS